MKRRTQVKLTVVGWSLAAAFTASLGEPPSLALPVTCTALAALGAVVGSVWSRRYGEDEPADLTYGPIRMTLVILAPFVVAALGIYAILRPPA